MKGKYVYDYPRPAVSVDMVIVTKEKKRRVLLIRRKHDPFAGMWALPGGFVDMDESLETAAKRELKEETGVVGVALEQLHTFGDPGRDPRGRVISIVYLAQVDPASLQPQAGDDAAEAAWYPLNDPPPLAFDHQEILAKARERLTKKMGR